jgi:hypothetical protein
MPSKLEILNGWSYIYISHTRNAKRVNLRWLGLEAILKDKCDNKDGEYPEDLLGILNKVSVISVL